MARADVKGITRYLPTPVQSALGVVALSAIVSGAAVQRRRKRSARGKDPTVWATSGSTGRRRDDD